MSHSSSGLNVLIPACGVGRRFYEAGYSTIKPLIDVAMAPMVQHVIDSFRGSNCTVFLPSGDATSLGRTLLDGARVVGLTPGQCHMGAVQTILAGADYCDWDAPVFVVNSDNVICPDGGWEDIQRGWLRSGCSAAIVLFEETRDGPYSWAGPVPSIRHIAEKAKISDYACAGAFWFKSYALLHTAATVHLAGAPDIGKEYYVAPMISRVLKAGGVVGSLVLDSDDMFVRIGVPEDIPLAEQRLL